MAGGCSPNRNYLRVRGEYFDKPQADEGLGELPPRARRIPHAPNEYLNYQGTTSACAENTFHKPLCEGLGGNYLRVRGEYHPVKPTGGKNSELPPRARRIRAMTPAGLIRRGTTSACAENTPHPSPAVNVVWNYLRVRGEYGGGAPGDQTF